MINPKFINYKIMVNYKIRIQRTLCKKIICDYEIMISDLQMK